MKEFEKNILIGVVFDLSSVQEDGSKTINAFKDILLKKVLEIYPTSKIYVSHPQWKLPRDQGESTYCLISYQESANFSVDFYFKNAINLVGECKDDYLKYVFLFTDRFQTPYSFQYQKGLLMNDLKYNNEIFVFGIGDHYDDITLQTIVKNTNANFLHLSSIEDFAKKLLEILGTIDGKNFY